MSELQRYEYTGLTWERLLSIPLMEGAHHLAKLVQVERPDGFWPLVEWINKLKPLERAMVIASIDYTLERAREILSLVTEESTDGNTTRIYYRQMVDSLNTLLTHVIREPYVEARR